MNSWAPRAKSPTRPRRPKPILSSLRPSTAGRRCLSSEPPRASVFTPFLRRFTDERARDLRDTIALYNEVHAAHRASIWSKDDAVKRASTFIAERVGETVELPTSLPVLTALDRCSEAVLRLETTLFTFPDINWATAHLSIKEQVDLRRFLRAQQHFLANDERLAEMLVLALGNVICGFIQALSELPASDGETTFTVPLI